MMKKSTKTHRSKIAVSIDEVVYINEMIKKNFDPLFSFVPMSPVLMKVIHNLHSSVYGKYIHLLEKIIQCPCVLVIKYPSKEYLSLFGYILLFLIENEDFSKGEPAEFKQKDMINLVLDAIVKLYENGSLHDVDVSSLVVLIIAMSIEPRKEIAIKANAPTAYTDICNKKVKHLGVFNLAIELVVKSQSHEVTEIFCTYCQLKVFLNKTNLFMLMKEMKLLHLLEIGRTTKQMDLLSKVYAKRYSKGFIDYFMTNMTKALQADKDKVKEYYPVLKKQTDFLFQLNKEESDEINQDAMSLKRGFVSNNTSANGLFVSNIIVKENFSVLFSFNYAPTPSSNQDSQTYIMVFKSGPVTDEKNKLLLKDMISFSLIKRKFYLRVLDDKEAEILEVKPHITYLVYFSLKEREEYLLSIKSQDSQWMHKKECKKMLLKKNFVLYVGKYFKYNFEGYIGPILVFKSLFEENFRFFCFSLKGNYEKLLFLPEYNLNQIDKYDRDMNNINEENAEYFKSISFFQRNKDANKQLLCYITPLCSIEKLNKTIYKNFLFKECKVNYNKEPQMENEGMFFFENKSLIFEFLKYNGIDFLILNYEFYGKVMTQSRLTVEEYKELETNLCSLFEMSIELFNLINVELFLAEIKRLVFAISKFLRTMAETHKLQGELFVLLNKWLILLSSQNPEINPRQAMVLLKLRNQFCMLLLDSSLYDMKHYSVLEDLLCAFENSLVKNRDGLGTSTVAKQLIALGQFYEGFDKTPEFTKTKQVYNSVLARYLKKNEMLELYFELFYSFSDKVDLGYKEYQLMQIFYRQTEVIPMYSEKGQMILVYFIKLFEHLNNNGKCRLNGKQREIVKAICLRIIMEYPISDQFYCLGNTRNKKKKLQSFRINPLPNPNINLMSDKPTQSILTSTYIQDTLIEDNAFEDKLMDEKLIEEKLIDDNAIEDKNKEEAIEPIPNKNLQELLMNIFDKYKTYEKVCENIHRASDYLIKSLMLVLFDLDLKPDQKLLFIKKAKEYLSINQYPFVLLTEYTTEIKKMLLCIVALIEKNKTELTFAYELFLYLVMKVAREREQNFCVFNHFLSSKKILGKVFGLSHHSNEANYLIQGEFNDIIKYILPYHKSSFVFDFVKNLTLSPGQEKKGAYFTNILLRTQYQNKTSKCYFFNQINLVLMLHEILKNESILKTGQFIFECDGLTELAKSDLIKTRFNLLQYYPDEKEKKTYLDILFGILFKLLNYSTKGEYDSLLNSTFYSNSESPWLMNDLLHFSNNEKTFYVNTLLSKHFKPVPYASISGHFCLKFLVNLTDEDQLENMKEKLVQIYLDLQTKSYNEAKLFYKLYPSDCSKQFKNCPIYALVNDLINTGIKNGDFTVNKTLYEFKEKISVNKIDMKQIPEALRNVQTADSIFFSAPVITDNSFSSCSSTKSQKARCIARKKPKERKKAQEPNGLLNPVARAEVGDEDDDEEGGFKQIVQDPLTNFDISSVISSDEVVLFPKDALLLKVFGIYFAEVYFKHNEFIQMKDYYKRHFEREENNGIIQTIDCAYCPNYPSVIRNYTPLAFYFKGFFLRPDLDFFNDPLFKYTHPYYLERITNELKAEKRLFPPRSLSEIIIPVKNQDFKRMYCELVTNKGVIFGHVLIYKNFFYFENLNRQIETNKKLDEENKHLFLFCSNENDFITKPKKIHIFEKNIFQIINRRFLYQFQACEVYLLNGKSYFFNFFTEGMKIDFFKQLESWSIDIIVDLKDRFKTKEFAKKWHNGLMSNLEYLLLLNKFASRSFNDTNQYPVFPWMTLSQNKPRNLKYTTVAQSNAQQQHLAEKYSLIESNFNAHYFTHFSNSSFVLYYLVRLNPFTNNQVIFQGNKLEGPNRQFDSIEETFGIVESTYDSREAIPEFYLMSEHFYNVNCVLFGFRGRDKRIVHNLIPLNNQSPIRFIIEQKQILNSNETKESLHHFINNIFGRGQIGLRDNYNTYEKYCYQELISLTEKKQKYINDNMKLEEIKTKINRKINKIISFGQTPYKLLEDDHIAWVSPENNKLPKEQGLNQFDSFQMISLKNKIITIVPGSRPNYFCVLMKSASTFYEIKILNSTTLQTEEKYGTVVIDKKFKKLDKFKLSDSPPIIGYKYNPKFIFIEFNVSVFVLCRFLDDSFKLFNSHGESVSFITDSFVTCLVRTKEKHFITGHVDGRIMEWSLGGTCIALPQLISEERVTLIRTLIAHKKEVSALYYSNTLGIVISSGNEQVIFIRKYFDLCLVGMIDIKRHYLYEVRLSNFFLYFTLYSEQFNKYTVRAYTLNGVKLYSIDEDFYNNIDIGGNGTILMGNTREQTITVLTPEFKAKNVIYMDFNNRIEKNRRFLQFFYTGSNTIIGAISNDIIVKYIYQEEDEVNNTLIDESA